MKVIGTAGHIDHGKSALVRALTGIDPDRLEEERRRGMTIDLGFAWLTLPSGSKVSIIDVPGHERFVKNMLAGVAGIDLALVVVAANESVMPQTREHLDILDLLGVSHGVVALTKSDLVDHELLQVVQAETADAIRGTTLAESPIIPVSVVNGEGLHDLVQALDAALQASPPKRDIRQPLLPIDRVFSIGGFGTVVTGTLQDGGLRLGMDVELVPGNRRARIRNLQTHNSRVEDSGPGDRVAVNLVGIEREAIRRGDVLAVPDSVAAVRRLYARIQVVRHAPFALSTGVEATVHVGSSERQAVLTLIGADQLFPGQTGWASLRVDEPVPAVCGQRLIVRLPMPARTIAGGTIIWMGRPLRRNQNRTSLLSQLASDDPEQRVLAALRVWRYSTPREIAVRLRTELAEVERGLRQGDAAGHAVRLGDGYMASEDWDTLRAAAEDAARQYHLVHPLKRGMPKEELRARVHSEPGLWPAVLGKLVHDGVLSDSGALVAIAGHRPGLEARSEEMDRVLGLLRESALAPPPAATLLELAGTDGALLSALADAGEVVRTGEGLYFARDVLEWFCAQILLLIDAHGSISVAEVRDQFGTSRKNVLALLEYLDDQRITRRAGDRRVRGSRAAECA